MRIPWCIHYRLSLTLEWTEPEGFSKSFLRGVMKSLVLDGPERTGEGGRQRCTVLPRPQASPGSRTGATRLAASGPCRIGSPALNLTTGTVGAPRLALADEAEALRINA